MITHIGWAVFVGPVGERRYLESLIAGKPTFVVHPKDAKFMDEYDAHQDCAVLVRMGYLARVQYIPFSERRAWNRTADSFWSK